MLRDAARSLLGRAAAAVDRAATMAAYAQTARSRRRNAAESLSHEERVDALGKLGALYDEVDAEWYRGPRPIAPRRSPVRALSDGGEVVDLRWPSDYQPFLPELRERYQKARDNADAAARLFLHPEPRPLMVLIHGYMAGQHPVEERMWPTAWLYRIGLVLALFVLPFHGVRAIAGRRGPPPFPGSDPRLTNEGFRQAMGDLRDLLAHLREQSGLPAGIMGMSLGGYTAALAVTVEPALDFAVPVIPLTSLADFARDQGRLGNNAEEEAREHALLDRVHHPISPLHRSSLVSPERVLIIAAEADRITPIAHARRLADHFGARLEAWHGGHLLQLGRSDKLREVGRFLADLELLAPRGSA